MYDAHALKRDQQLKTCVLKYSQIFAKSLRRNTKRKNHTHKEREKEHIFCVLYSTYERGLVCDAQQLGYFDSTYYTFLHFFKRKKCFCDLFPLSQFVIAEKKRKEKDEQTRQTVKIMLGMYVLMCSYQDDDSKQQETV